MPEAKSQAEQAHEQNMAALMQQGQIVNGHMATFTKVLDYDYLESKKLVSQTEAMGVREVMAKHTPAGPNDANAA